MDVDPGANSGYMISAYVITAVILFGYGVILWRRVRKGSQGAREPGS